VMKDYKLKRGNLRSSIIVVYYESMKRKLKIKPIYECRCNGRLQTKRFTRLEHTGLVGELEHLKIKTRLTNEKFASVTVALARARPTFPLSSCEKAARRKWNWPLVDCAD
jgi:hypothetical protein